MDLSDRRNDAFTSLSVPRAVSYMVIPAIISQIIHVVYNLADTWFVGLTGDPNAVAAISLCLPVYNILTGLSNLFGVGGASVIARAAGYGDKEKAKRAFAVSVWAAFLSALFYSVLLLFLEKPVLLLIGGDEGDISFAVQYSFVTIVLGGVPTVLSATFSNLIRAHGESRKAAAGITIGAVINILLDPLFMFVLLSPGHEVLGAALATAVSNLASLIYFFVFLIREQDEIYGFTPFLIKQSRLLLEDIMRSGAPGFIMVALAMLSNCFLNAMISSYGGGAAMAGLGIVRKIDSLAYAVNQGITQGMLPLVAYCYASGRHSRMKHIIAFSTACTVSFSLVCSALSYLFAPQLIDLFIDDRQTILYGAEFMRVLCLAIPIYSITFVLIAAFQGVGRSTSALILSLLHKGSLDILLLFLFRMLFGVYYVIWATPVTEFIAMAVGIILLVLFLRERERPNIKEVIQ